MKIETGEPKRSRRGIGVSKKTAIGIVAVLIAGTLIASGALLTNYGSIKTTAEIGQSVQIKAGGGDEWRNYDDPIMSFVVPDHPGGESFCFKFWVRNWASIPARILFDNIVTAKHLDGTWMDPEGAYAAVYAFPDEDTVLELTSKDDDWQPDGRMEATLTFDPISTTFDYDLTTTGLKAGTEYALIYYPDQPDRFASDSWNGYGGMVISTFTISADGTYNVTGQSVDLGRNMPDGNDWNIHPGDEYNNDPDNYEHWRGGAKIWIVPIADLTNDDSLPLDAWHQDQYLFETDLVTYSDCNLEEVPWTMSLWGTEITSATTIPSGETVPFFVCYSFALTIEDGIYTMSTFVNPAKEADPTP